MYLTVNNLNLSFENKKLYSDASFRILPGDKIGVVGSNGVGKTTLINVLCGNLIPDSGEIKFDEKTGSYLMFWERGNTRAVGIIDLNID